jgi:cysteine desulfurase
VAPGHYLDHASTSPLRPEARAAITAWLDTEPGAHGDPARVHAAGRTTRVAIESARDQIAAILGARQREVVFTASATEAINMAVHGAAAARPGRPIVAAGVEHSAVREACAHATAVITPGVDRAGRFDPDEIAAILAEQGPDGVALVNCQLANHEVGTLQPVAEIVRLCREHRTLVHVDAACAIGHMPFDFAEIGADLCSVSAHKIGGPPGAGALLIRRGLRLEPLIVGSEQERARRAGYENTLGIIGFGAVAEALAGADTMEREIDRDLSNTDAIRKVAGEIEDAEILGETDPALRLPNLVCIAVGGVESEAILLALDRAGIAVHSGSACSSESLQPSPVLAAMGVDADRSLRVSVGWSTTDEDISALARHLPDAVDQLRALRLG